VIGVAFEGGRLPEDFKGELRAALHLGISLVNGLHTLISEDAELAGLASENGVRIIDIRKPKPFEQLHFWTGKIREVTVPRVAVLGMDCAVGKRTTCGMLLEGLGASGIQAETIYTGQTGWLEGHRYGCIVDSTLNDFVSGELEHAVVTCFHEQQPDLILIEGQSSLRNPSGPFGAELLLSVQAKHVVLQHDPRRIYFDDDANVGFEVPAVRSEIKLIRRYGAQVIAVTLHPAAKAEVPELADQLSEALALPVVWAEKEGMRRIVDNLAAHLPGQSLQ
ncbi:MAG: DUF1611 domain-containing protein, partial [Saprospiraceae bacterium]|nr:DUF1611 domain-containing protein [Saprospiraceae bacterium]